jgi:20S proteasome alpha/beta subunit
MKYGMTFKDFRTAVGRNEIPAGTAAETFTEIANIGFDCSLILCIFSKKFPSIYRIDSTGLVNICDHFAAIGSGSPIAEGVLYQREHRADMPLGRTIYHVFEAMKLGSIASDVGKEHTIDVLYPPGERGQNVVGDTLTTKADAFLNRKFAKLGPKKFSQMPLPAGFFAQDFV